MGDRANICLRFEDGNEIYLYSHGSGSLLPEKLAEALAFGVNRWDDEQYLARIITSRVFADLVDAATGGGLSPYLGDGAGRVLDVDLPNQKVTVRGSDRSFSFRDYPGQHKLIEWSD